MRVRSVCALKRGFKLVGANAVMFYVPLLRFRFCFAFLLLLPPSSHFMWRKPIVSDTACAMNSARAFFGCCFVDLVCESFANAE